MSPQEMTALPLHHMHQDHTLHILLFGVALILAAIIGIRENHKKRISRTDRAIPPK